MIKAVLSFLSPQNTKSYNENKILKQWLLKSVAIACILLNDERKSNVLYYTYRNFHIKLEPIVLVNTDYFCY